MRLDVPEGIFLDQERTVTASKGLVESGFNARNAGDVGVVVIAGAVRIVMEQVAVEFDGTTAAAGNSEVARVLRINAEVAGPAVPDRVGRRLVSLQVR